MGKELTSGSAKELNQRIQERYDIGRAMVYKRLRHLDIQPSKQGSQVWLTTDQLNELDKLNQHLLEGGKLEDYSPHQNGIVVAETAEIESYQTSSLEHGAQAIRVEPIGDPEPELAARQRTAKTQAAGNLIYQNLLAQHYMENPELLDPDLKEAVAASEAYTIPKPVDPWEYAQAALKRSLAST
jgi:hypothetical protein